jgi:hypothetical protein
LKLDLILVVEFVNWSLLNWSLKNKNWFYWDNQLNWKKNAKYSNVEIKVYENHSLKTDFKKKTETKTMDAWMLHGAFILL